MSWLWHIDDFDLRVNFARSNGPVDFLTLLTRLVLTRVTSILTLILAPVDMVLKFVGKGLIAVVLGMMLLIVLHGLWMIFWLPLMGMSWAWARYAWARPVLIVPGVIIAIFGHIFLMLVPDPHKNAQYVVMMTREWPLSWQLYKPPEAFFEQNPFAER